MIPPIHTYNLSQWTLELMRQVEFGATVCWTFDMLLCCFTGYQSSEGKIELRVTRIVRRYLQCWFWLDFGLVLNDWVSIAGAWESSGFVRLGKNAVRMIRF